MPIVAEREVIRQIQHPTVGEMPIVRSPVRFAGRFEDPAIQPAPLLGEHTAQILTGLLSYDHAKVEALARDGAVLVAAVQPT